MSRQDVADATEKSVASFVGMVVIVAILMTVFLQYFLKNQDSYTEVALNTAASRFVSQLQAIRGQWLLANRPSNVQLSTLDGKQVGKPIWVNKFGWADVKDNTAACQLIWKQVMDSPLKILNYPVSVIEIKAAQENQHYNGKICRYFLSDTIYFEYNSENGKVTKSN